MAYAPAPLLPYTTAAVPRGFPLANTGAICYFNTMLQSLASCPSFVQAVANNLEYMSKTLTGSALYNFVQHVIKCAAEPVGRVEANHSYVLVGLLRDLKKRKPRFEFGQGMDSAAIALDLLLDMSEPESAKAAAAADGEKVVSDQAVMIHQAQAQNPIASLFRLRVATKVCCKTCEALGERYEDQPPGIVSVRKDTCYSVEYFNYDTAGVRNEAEFVHHLLVQTTHLDDYHCEKCEKAGRPTANLCASCASNGLRPQGACEDCKSLRQKGGEGNCERCVQGGRPTKCAACAAAKGNSVRRYEVEKIPTILFIRFNQYVGHRKRYFPIEMHFSSKEGGKLRYSLVAQMEHSGSLSGGHYWAHGVRKSAAGDKLVSCSLNDASVGAVKLGPTASTYCVVYHFTGTEK